MQKEINLIIFLIILLINTAKAESDLTWNLTATVPKTEKTIITNICGSGVPGRLHAIIGPSGSGKSTLLNILAHTIPKRSLRLEGLIHHPDGFGATPLYVQQEDLLFPQLTVDETLMTSAQFKPTDNFDIKNLVNGLIRRLGLVKSRNTKIGDSKTRGISGGEKKRVSIANEFIGNNHEKQIIFADEPTSGLDAFQANRIMEVLRDLAAEGNIVIASIHQPRTSIFQMIDDITLLSEGKVMYSGSTKNMLPYFSNLGYPCPGQTNPAEYYLDLVSVDYSSKEREGESKQRISELAVKYEQSSLITRPQWKSSNTMLTNGYQPPKISILKRVKRSCSRFATLFIRAWRSVTRDKSLNVARLMSNLFSALLFGAIYFRMDNGASRVPDRLGLLQVAAVNTAMSALIKATTSFVSEKLIIQRERRNNAYGVLPYFIAKLIAEVPLSAFFPCMSGFIMYKLCGLNPAPGRLLNFMGILTVESIASTAMGMAVGSVVPSVESGIAVAPAVMVLFIVFGGLYVVNTPSYLSWVPESSLIRWAYEALCVNEFSGLEIKPEARIGPKAVTAGEQVLDSLGYGKSTVGNALFSLGKIIFVNYAITIFSLAMQKPSSEVVKTPKSPADME